MSVEIRTMRRDDAEDAARVWIAAWGSLEQLFGEEHREVDDGLCARTASRYRYLLASDPRGCWVAETSGTIVGLAISHLRGDRYMLANLGVLPEYQGSGVGGRLLESVLRYGETAATGLICSSPDPRAMRRYVQAGFALSPAMDARGRRGPAGDGQLRRSDGSPRDLALLDELDDRVRGSQRHDDIGFLLDLGAELWIDDGGGYALLGERDVTTLCAIDDRIGRRMLAALLGGQVTGIPMNASWLTASAPWAFQAAVDAGATLRSHGAVMTRGPLEWHGAYLPSGVFG